MTEDDDRTVTVAHARRLIEVYTDYEPEWQTPWYFWWAQRIVAQDDRITELEAALWDCHVSASQKERSEIANRVLGSET